MKRLSIVILAVLVVAIMSIFTWGYNTLKTVEATVNGNIKVYCDNQQKILTDTDGSQLSPVVINGRTYLPIRSVAELSGLNVEWDSATQSIMLSSKNSSAPSPQNDTNSKKELSLWHFYKDDGEAIVKSFNEAFPNIKVNLSIISDRNKLYQNRLTTAIKAGAGVPDVYAVESAYTKEFIDMPNAFADLTEKAKDYIGNMAPYTVEVGTDKNGTLRALSPDIMPVAMAYKKSVAKKYLGSDDPKLISAMLSLSQNLLSAAKVVKEKSGGKVALFPGFEEIEKIYLGGRSQPWVVNNKLTIDQKMLDFIDLAKTLRDNKYEAAIDQWSPAWSSAIADDEKALFWECPSWGIPWIIGSEDKKATEGGRWGLAKPQFQTFWGGTWYGIYSKSPKQDTAWEFLKNIATNKETMKKWAEDEQAIPNNLNIIAEGSPEDDKIVGTNLFKFFEPFIQDINGKILTKHDESIERVYTECLRSYLAGKIKTKEDMIKEFKNTVKMELGI
ncbi:MAG: extracellular solute-binding protein [Bacillota bacterium]|nr:extracellular solute-binding protein [Bacillota bacterium]